MALENTFMQLQDLGLFDVLLPFILVFTIVFAVLQKINLFGVTPEDKRKAKPFNTTIALVMGLGVVFPHVLGYYPPDRDIVIIINRALPNVSVVLVAILMALIVIGVMGRRFEIGRGSASGWIAMAAVLIIFYIFGSAANWWQLPDWLYMLRDPDIQSLVIVILVFAIMIWFITKTPAEEIKDEEMRKKLRDESFMGQVGNMFK